METIVTPRLVSTRFRKIDIHVGPGDRLEGGGKMSVEVTAGLNAAASNSRQILAETTITILGIPNKAKDDSDFAFKAEIVGQGIYEWPEKVPDNLQDSVLTETLCQPIYVLLVQEVTSLVQRTGLGTINLPWTINENGKEPAKKKTPAKKSAPRRAKKAVTP